MAAQKRLEPGSKYASFDKDGDGIVTDEEFEMEQKLVQLENEDKKQDAQRNMAWFALGGMLLYPAFVIAATDTKYTAAISPSIFAALSRLNTVAAIVAAFYGKEALAKKK